MSMHEERIRGRDAYYRVESSDSPDESGRMLRTWDVVEILPGGARRCVAQCIKTRSEARRVARGWSDQSI